MHTGVCADVYIHTYIYTCEAGINWLTAGGALSGTED